MRKNPIKQGDVAEGSVGIGTVTPKMVRKRARELAVINGRPDGNPLDSDVAEARRELTGRSEIDPKTEILESAPQSERWDPVPGSPGHKAQVTGNEDEDEEGRSDAERLVEEGAEEAEHERMREAGENPPRQR